MRSRSEVTSEKKDESVVFKQILINKRRMSNDEATSSTSNQFDESVLTKIMNAKVRERAFVKSTRYRSSIVNKKTIVSEFEAIQIVKSTVDESML